MTEFALSLGVVGFLKSLVLSSPTSTGELVPDNGALGCGEEHGLKGSTYGKEKGIC